MPILHDSHVSAYYDALQEACVDPSLNAYMFWLDLIEDAEAYEIF